MSLLAISVSVRVIRHVHLVNFVDRHEVLPLSRSEHPDMSDWSDDDNLEDWHDQRGFVLPVHASCAAGVATDTTDFSSDDSVSERSTHPL